MLESAASTTRTSNPGRHLTLPVRPNRFEIDLAAITHNVREVRKLIGPGTQLFAALKANAYGYGLIEVADTVLSAGADALAMVDLKEAAALRQHGIVAPILLYGGIRADQDSVAVVEQYELMPTILDLDDAKTYARYAQSTIQSFVKVDVGFERLGVAPDETIAFLKALQGMAKLRVHGIYTHMHVPAGEAPEVGQYIAWQFGRFDAVLQEAQRAGFQIPLKIAASSGSLRLSTSIYLNAVDPGAMLYGMPAAGPTTVSVDLRPAFRALKSHIIHTRPIEREMFRELAPFPLRPGMCIGVLPIGIADGMLSLHCGQVLVRGRRAAILGISLEHTRIDITDVDAQVGDEAVIIGRQENDEIRLCDVVDSRQLPTELAVPLTVGPTVGRVYLGGAKEMKR